VGLQLKLSDISKNLEDEWTRNQAEVINTIIDELRQYAQDVKNPALVVGEQYALNLILSQTSAILDLEAMTDDQVAALPSEQLLRRATIMAANAGVMAEIAAVEAANQQAASEVRARTDALLTSILAQVGKVGLSLLGAAVA